MGKDLRTKIEQLAAASTVLEPKGEQLEKLTSQITAYAHDYLNKVDELKAYNKEHSQHNTLTSTPIPEKGRPLTELLRIIAKDVDTPGINPASGNHMGYIPGGGIYPTAMGDYLAAATNQYAGIFYASPGGVQMENLLIRWLATVMGFPKDTLGNLTSGGSMANLIAIVTARDASGITADRVTNACIYLTQQVHHSVQKAIRIAGLAEATIRYIDTDEYFRMDTEALEEQLKEDLQKNRIPFLVIASAGTTDTGAIDPFDEIARLARGYDLWFHVDAAYGGFFMLVDELQPKFSGISEADSLTIDPHKGMFLSYGLGAVIVKDIQALNSSHHYLANYMQDAVDDSEEPSPADLSPELTKHFRGLRMWLPLQLFGVRPFRKALYEKHLLCRYFYTKVQELGFETGPEPELSVAIYRYTHGVADANRFNEKLIKAIQTDGRVFVSSTTIDNIFWLRIAILVFRTHLAEVDRLLTILEEKKTELLLRE